MKKKSFVLKKLEKLNEFAKKPVGIFGDVGAGKTVYFTVLYHQKSSENGEVRITNSEKTDENQELKNSELYLRKNYLQYLSKGMNIPSTEIFGEQKLKLNYSYNNIEYHMTTYDYSGELTKNQIDRVLTTDTETNSSFKQKEFEEHQKNLYGFFDSCKSIMVFLEFTENISQKEHIVQNISDLLNAIEKNKKSSSNTGLINPLAIIITKWDHYSTMDLGFEEESKKTKKSLENDIQYKKIFNQIKNFTDEKVEIFPLSSFGGSIKSKTGEEFPPESIDPKFLFNPLIWLANRYDQFYKKEIEDFLERATSSKDFQMIGNFINNNIGNTEIKEELINQVNKKRAASKKKGRIIKFVSALIVIMIIFSAIKIVGDIKYFEFEKMYKSSINIYEKRRIVTSAEDNLLLSITNPQKINTLKKEFEDTEEEQKKVAFEIINNTNSLSLKKESLEDFLFLYGNETEYQVALAQIKENTLNEEVKKKYQLITEMEDNENKKEEIKNFLNEFPDHVLSIDLKNELARVQGTLDLTEAYSKLLEEIQYQDNDYDRYLETKKFLNRYKNIDNYEEINAQAESYLFKAEKKLYDQIKLAEQRQDRESMQEYVNTYLYRDEFKMYINEVNTIDSKILTLNEQDLANEINENVHIYNNFINENSNDVESIRNQIDSIIELCNDYSAKGFAFKSWIQRTQAKSEEIKNSGIGLTLEVIIFGQYGMGLANNSFKTIVSCDDQKITLEKALNTKVPESVGTTSVVVSPWSYFKVEIYRNPFGPFKSESYKGSVEFNFAELNEYKNFTDNGEPKQIKLDINKALFEIPGKNGY
jgi:hypothetical protein